MVSTSETSEQEVFDYVVVICNTEGETIIEELIPASSPSMAAKLASMRTERLFGIEPPVLAVDVSTESGKFVIFPEKTDKFYRLVVSKKGD